MDHDCPMNELSNDKMFWVLDAGFWPHGCHGPVQDNEIGKRNSVKIWILTAKNDKMFWILDAGFWPYGCHGPVQDNEFGKCNSVKIWILTAKNYKMFRMLNSGNRELE